MKRFLISVLSLVMIFCLGAIMTGCGDEQSTEEEVVGTFYSLQEAYDKGLLTQGDLISIAYYHHNQTLGSSSGMEFNTELMGDNYHPIEKSPKKLSKKLEYSIKQTLFNDLINRNFSNHLNLDNISICAYYGSYRGGVVIRLLYIEDGSCSLDEVECEDIVAGVKFYYSEYTSFFNSGSYNFSNAIVFWKEIT